MFKNIHIRDIPPFCVIIGANGTGKSTLFDIFGFLRDALKNNIRQALQIRGGYREIITRGQEQEDIEIELQFRMKILDTERLVTYQIIIGQNNNRPVKYLGKINYILASKIVQHFFNVSEEALSVFIGTKFNPFIF